MEQNLEQRVTALEERNKRVEFDKAWEGSRTRRALIMLCTYVILGFYMQAIGTKSPWLGAIVPTTGFLLSTLTLAWVKRRWIQAKLHS